MTNPLLFSDFIYTKTRASKELDEHLQTIHNLIQSIIMERQQYLSSLKAEMVLENGRTKHKKPQCLLDTLLTSEVGQKPLSLKEIKDEVNTFVLAVSIVIDMY